MPLLTLSITTLSKASLYLCFISHNTLRHSIESIKYENLPKVGEPLDQLGGIVLVEANVREEGLQNSRRWIANVEEHQLGLAQVHRRQGARVTSNHHR